MVIDDSALVRQVLKRVLESDEEIEVIATAANPYDAAALLAKQVPDVITLDVEMPRMDGLTFLRKLMDQHPIPVVICSGLAGPGAETGALALEAGAVTIIQKPRIGTREFLEESQLQLCNAVKSAAGSKRQAKASPSVISRKLTADAVLPWSNSHSMIETTDKVVVIGASTGGTEALRVLLEGFPADAPGAVVVQHMPENFTAAFAKRLNDLCDVSVKEAKNGDSVLRGHVLIAPGNRHTLLRRSGAHYYVEVRDGPLVCRQRPSVDVLFRSAAKYAGRNTIGVLLTGMGDDGARGMLELKQCGAWNIAQDEASSVVWGMPLEAIKLKAVDLILPIDKIASGILGRHANV